MLIELVGRVVVFIVALIILLLSSPAQEAAAQDTKPVKTRHLIVCVDGVGFDTIQEMRAAGRFKIFREPARMIAPFPTLTNLSMTEILRPAGAGEAVGYEDAYFDAGKNKLRGGLLDRVRGNRFIKGTFRELFDYHPSALKSALGYAAPPASTYVESLTDLLRLKQKFRATRAPVFIAYTGASDSLAHLGGKKMLTSFLARLDDAVEELAREGEVEVSIFSDHGNDFVGYRRASLKSALRREGFKLGGDLKDERSVVFPQFGLVGCAVMWTREENEARLAEAVARARGVDFAAYEQAGVVHIVGAAGRALIEGHGGRLSYRLITGDPLELKSVLEDLRAAGKVDSQGFVADDDWFAATSRSARPDAVRRIYEGVTVGTRNRANVIVSLADGFYTGSAALDVFAFLQATHGNIGQRQSLGFVMSTRRELPEYLRAREVWSAIGSPLPARGLTHNLARQH